ncbi:MAG: bifunctional nuclease family protein, partial [Dehalococcoidia bacterium]
MIEMTIESIRVSLVNYQRVVMLKEKNTLRYLPIWIGSAEAQAIAIRLQEGIQVQRPMTHDLLSTTIEVLGAKVEHVIVNDLKNDTFYAKILLNIG